VRLIVGGCHGGGVIIGILSVLLTIDPFFHLQVILKLNGAVSFSVTIDQTRDNLQ
jgi:hypothetical protein